MFCWSNCDDKQKDSTNLKIKKIQNYLYKKHDKIGQGNFSQVYQGIDDETGQSVAVKVVEISSIKTKIVLDMLQAQISLIKELDHPNIIKCINTLNSCNNYYIITEYCEQGDLERYLKLHGALDEHEVENIAYDIFQGLQYLFQNSIIHRDLKTTNILIREGVSKIGDFGFAVKSQTNFRDISVGSPLYMSPEGLLRCQYGPKTDVWSFGILIYQLLHGFTPLSHCQNQKQLRIQILKPPKFNNNTISKDIKNFIILCLDPNQKTRISIPEIRNTSFMKKIIANVENGKIRTGGINEKYGQNKLRVIFNNLLDKIRPQEAISLLHYCRVIHKSINTIPSMILSQWLLTLSQKLVSTTLDCTRQKALKVAEVLKGYHNKYIKEHKVNLIERSVSDAIQQCHSLQRSPYDKEYTKIILQQSQLLLQSLNSGSLVKFTKHSKCEQFLSKKVLQASKVEMNINRQTYKLK